MKFLYPFLFASILLINLISCNNDINVAAPYKDIPLIYGKLNASDSIQYIRIQKGFLSNTTDATVLAKFKDSIYYPEKALVVVLTNAKGDFRDTLKRVNGNDYGIFKDSGIFYNQENILYRCDKKLSNLTNYTISCYNVIANTNFSATSNTIGEFDIISPNTIPPINNPPTIYFAKDSFGTYQNFQMTIRKKLANDNDDWNQYSFGVDILLSYDEWNVNNPSVVTTKKLVWKAFNFQTIAVSSKLVDIKINGSTLFSSFSNIKKDKNIVRKMNPSANIIVKIANSYYTQFLNTRNVQSGSISSDEALPIYTNVKNGIGLLYGDVAKEHPVFILSPALINYVACDNSTIDYNFFNATGKLCR